MRLIDADELSKKVLEWMPPDPCGVEEKEFPFEEDICVSLMMEIQEAPTVTLEEFRRDKYVYHYDHTDDCIWYRNEAINRCPVTCAQYRDGWNDAMNYIFRDGKGYRPYRRGQEYGE